MQVIFVVVKNLYHWHKSVFSALSLELNLRVISYRTLLGLIRCFRRVKNTKAFTSFEYISITLSIEKKALGLLIDKLVLKMQIVLFLV